MLQGPYARKDNYGLTGELLSILVVAIKIYELLHTQINRQVMLLPEYSTVHSFYKPGPSTPLAYAPEKSTVQYAGCDGKCYYQIMKSWFVCYTFINRQVTRLRSHFFESTVNFHSSIESSQLDAW